MFDSLLTMLKSPAPQARPDRRLSVAVLLLSNRLLNNHPVRR